MWGTCGRCDVPRPDRNGNRSGNRRGNHQNKSGPSRSLGLRRELDPVNEGETEVAVSDFGNPKSLSEALR